MLRLRHILTALFLALGLTVTALATQPFSQALFSPIDPRAIYGKYAFPEPLLAPEMDVDAELRFDWFHSEKKHLRDDEIKGELEYSFGYLTLELGSRYERHEQISRDLLTSKTIRSRDEGIGNVELSARYPLYQFVSGDGSFEYTLVGALELALPSGSHVSKDTEVVPQAFQLIRFGKRVTLQASVGLSSLVGPEQGGVNTLEYAAVLGYDIERQQLHLPGVLHLIPIMEITGQRTLSGVDKGVNRLSGTLGTRILLDSLGKFQPRLGIGYVLPLDTGARQEFRWGVITSLVFEF